MIPTLYFHPFSSYCQKVLIALYENATPFAPRIIGSEDLSAFAELEALWPLKQFPVLVDEGKTIIEASVIIEHLGLYRPGPVPLLPNDSKAALDARMMDRFFDSYIMNPMAKVVTDRLRPEDKRDSYGIAEARQSLETAYRWLDGAMAGRTWAAGDAFSLADCAAAPALFYADWVQEITETFTHARAYRALLLARPSFARAVDEARPYRPLFPLGAPDRD
jgi:glutathione S-transferase